MSKFEQEFEVMREIGRGGFGVVYECRNKVLDKEYAVKVVILPQNPKMSALVFREVRTLVRLEHPNVIRLHACWVEDQLPSSLRLMQTAENQSRELHASNARKTEKSITCVLFDNAAVEPTPVDLRLDPTLSNGVLCRQLLESSCGGSSYTMSRSSDGLRTPWDAIEKRAKENYGEDPVTWMVMFISMELAETTMADLLVGNYLDLSTRLRLFMQLVKGLEFLHENGIVHNDLKPSNLLIVKNELKIGDFGLSNFHLPLIAPMAGARLCGTPLYTSPDQTTSLKSDIFTLGVVLTEFLVDYGERYDALTTLRTPEFRWEAYETLQPFRQLIQRMLLTDPQSRPTASEVRHALMDNIKQYGFANTIACGIESGETRWEVEIPKPPTLKEFFEERAKTVSLENQLKVLQRTLIERDTSARATAHRVSELEAELAQVNQLNEMRKENSPKFNVSSDHINLPPKPSESQPQWREEAAQGA